MDVHSVPPSPASSASAEAEHPPLPGSRTGDIATAISTQVVGLLRERAGRGPTKASTAILDDLVLVTLSDCLTRAEQLLVEGGDEDLVDQLRHGVHHAMRAPAIAIIEKLTGRQVAAYLTDQHLDPDVAIIAFVLGPPTPLQIA